MDGKNFFVAVVLAIFLVIAAGTLFSPKLLSQPPSLRSGLTLVSIPTVSAATSGDLAIPYIAPSSLAVDSSGVSTVSGYIDYFVNHATGISFDGKQFSSVLKSKDGVILLPPELADKALADNNFQEVHNSLIVAKNFLDAKIVFEKAIKVTDAAVPLSQKMVGLDLLTEDLIQNALNVEAGTMTKSDLQAYLTQYYQTASDEHAKIANQVMGTTTDNHSLWAKTLEQFGLASIVHAQLPPFGGQIISIEWCACDDGWVVDVGSPVSATLFVPMGFFSSPLFYEYHQMNVGIWWLGLHTNFYVPCLEPSGDGCSDIGGGLLIYMTGTSGSGGGGGGGGGDGGGGGSGGSCTPITDPNSPCSVDNLSKTCFDGNALAASKICHAESGGNPFACGDRTTDGHPVSCGLYQINLTAHRIGGLNCPSAFDSMYTGSHRNVNIVDPALYDACVKAAQDPTININEACSISKNGTDWSQWSTASKCGV